MQDTTISRPWWLLKLTYGIVPIVAGLDKFTNILVDWKQYLSSVALRASPFSAPTFMHVVGVIEIVAGILVLTRYTRIFAYVVAAWMACIAINLLIAGFYDIAVRDVVMAIGAVALGELSAIHVPTAVPRGRPHLGMDEPEDVHHGIPATHAPY